MKIIKNIPGVIKFYKSLSILNRYKKNIKKYRAEGNLEKERENIVLATSAWGKEIVRVFNSELTVEGKENLPEKGPVVVVSNHQGIGDIPALCAALDKFQIGFIAKDSLKKIPLYGQWIDIVRSIFILRESPRESLGAIKKGVRYIEDGFSLVIFPEGTRSRGNEMGEFKKGSTKLATIPGVPIIPISLNGTADVYEKTGVLSSAKIKIIIHPPIITEGLTKIEEKAIPALVEKTVRDGVDKLVKEMA